MRLLLLIGLIEAVYLVSAAVERVFAALEIPLSLTAGSGAGQILLYTIALVMIFLFVHYIWRESAWRFLCLYAANIRKALLGFWCGAAVVLLSVLLWYSLMLRFGLAQWSWTAGDLRYGKLVISCLIAVVLATSEELIFRAFIFNYLRRNPTAFHNAYATLLSAVVFALSHRFRDLFSWLEPVNFPLLLSLSLLGGMLAVVYNRSRNLACAIGVHAAFIWAVLLKRSTAFYSLVQPPWWISNAADERTYVQTISLFTILIVVFYFLGPRLARLYGVEEINP